MVSIEILGSQNIDDTTSVDARVGVLNAISSNILECQKINYHKATHEALQW